MTTIVIGFCSLFNAGIWWLILAPLLSRVVAAASYHWASAVLFIVFFVLTFSVLFHRFAVNRLREDSEA